jgi:hypothetical protein
MLAGFPKEEMQIPEITELFPQIYSTQFLQNVQHVTHSKVAQWLILVYSFACHALQCQNNLNVRS